MMRGMGIIMSDAIVCKYFGYSDIPQYYEVHALDREQVNPEVGFHRPCLFAETVTVAKNRNRKRYSQKLMMMPCEKLKFLPSEDNF